MDVIYERVAGLDVHKETVVATVRVMVVTKVERECRTFATTTAGLRTLLAWLIEERCSHVAMEATGVYWKPVWNILSDGDFELIVANAAHIKNVPGRKTDVNDATWIADLLACGLIRGSFVPDEKFQELRALERTRKQLVREQTSHVQRLQKTLEEANIKLDSVISDVMGLSGRAMIEALIAGERDPERLARLAHRRIKATRQALCEALDGRVTDHHRFRLRLHLRQYDGLDDAISAVGAEIATVIARIDGEREAAGQVPFRTLSREVSNIPGIKLQSAGMILAEIGLDMGRFPTAGHIVAWTGLCPGQNESGGKRKPARLRKGAPWLKTTLVQCAVSASKKKDSYFRAQFQRLKSRRGAPKATCAVAASLLTTVYHMLKDGTAYCDLGAAHFDKRPAQVKVNRLVAQLAKLGYEANLRPLEEAA
jgi:transposase